MTGVILHAIKKDLRNAQFASTSISPFFCTMEKPKILREFS